MKKVISLFLAAAMAATVSTGAFAAATSGTDKLDQKISTLQARQQKLSDDMSAAEANKAKLTAKEPSGAFAQDLNQKRLGRISNREANITVLEQNNQIRLKIAQSMETLSKNDQKLSPDAKAQIKTYNAQIKEINEAIKASKDQIKALGDQNKTNIKNKDSAAVDNVFQQIYAIQTSRRSQLTQTGDLLQKIDTLVEGTPVSGEGSSGTSSAT